jgi:hypothetical protein
VNEVETGLAMLRVMVLIAWLFYFLFEKNTRRLLIILVILLVVPNALGVYMHMLGS